MHNRVEFGVETMSCESSTLKPHQESYESQSTPRHVKAVVLQELHGPLGFRKRLEQGMLEEGNFELNL
jgi:hypothetical protein